MRVKKQKHSGELGDREARSSPGTPSGVQSPSTDIADLANDFSRLNPREPRAADAISMSREAREGRHHGLETDVVGDHDNPSHAGTDAEGSSDEWQGPSSVEKIGHEGPFNRGRLEIVDRIMKSFCASLDSKIAAVKTSSPAIKEERDASQASNTTAITGRRERSFFKASPLRSSQAPPAPLPPVGGGSSGQRIAAPPPPPLPKFKRGARKYPNQPSVATGSDHGHAQQSQSLPTAGARPAGTETSHELLMLTAKRTRGTRSLVSPLSAAPAVSRSPTGPAEHTPASTSEQRTVDSLLLPPLDDMPGTRSNRRFTQTGHCSVLDSAIARTTSAEHTEGAHHYLASFQGPMSQPRQRTHAGIEFEEEEEEARGSSPLYKRYRSQTIRHSDTDIGSGDEEDSLAPTDASTVPDLYATYTPFPEAATQSFGPEAQLEFGDAAAWASRIGSQPSPYHPAPDVPDFLGPDPVSLTQTLVHPAEQEWPEMPEEQPYSQRIKRVAEPEETQHVLAHAHEEADGDGRRKKARRAVSSTVGAGEGAKRKFACPYFKRNPKKYRQWTSCPGPGWDEVHRVKTHLYRRHALPIQCPRCWESFKTHTLLQSHLQKDPPCAVRTPMLQEGFTKDQEKRLRSRKKTHADMTDEDKWREIYMILFPDDDQSVIPAPYYEPDGGEALTCSGELEDYATFIRREMPTLVRRELETLFQREFQDVEERVRPRIAEIVLNLQPRLLGLYKQSQMPLSDYGPHGGAASNSEPGLTPVSHTTGSGRATDPSSTGHGTEPGSTPDTALGLDGLPETDAELGLYGGTDWDTLCGENQPSAQAFRTSDLGLNWDLEFDKLLNPGLFMPPVQIPTVQGG